MKLVQLYFSLIGQKQVTKPAYWRDGEIGLQRTIGFFFSIYLPNRSFMTSCVIFTSERLMYQFSYWQNSCLTEINILSLNWSIFLFLFLLPIFLTYIPFYHTIFCKKKKNTTHKLIRILVFMNHYVLLLVLMQLLWKVFKVNILYVLCEPGN